MAGLSTVAGAGDKRGVTPFPTLMLGTNRAVAGLGEGYDRGVGRCTVHWHKALSSLTCMRATLLDGCGEALGRRLWGRGAGYGTARWMYLVGTYAG